MKCPYCFKEMAPSGVKVIDAMFNLVNNVLWYPEDQLSKKIKKDYFPLKFEAVGYYCDECMKVVGIFDTK